MRGDVARSLLYMVLRYESELGLAVTDCPPFDRTQIGYLSELLQWHDQDPPSTQEQARNQAVCERWQGNRNPLVDHPELVQTYFGTPDTIVESSLQYSKCTAPTAPPTAAPNACSELLPGDVQILIWNASPLNELVLYPVSRIPADVGSLFVTDRAWDGTQFVDNGEGTLEVRVSASALLVSCCVVVLYCLLCCLCCGERTLSVPAENGAMRIVSFTIDSHSPLFSIP